MLYSGAELIRKAGHQQEAFEKLDVAELKSVQPLAFSSGHGMSLDQDTQSALKRFAQKLNHSLKPKDKAATPVASSHPYLILKKAEQIQTDKGGLLDLYA